MIPGSMVPDWIIAEVLGLPKQVSSAADVERQIIKGLPKSCLRAIAARVAPDPRERDQLVYRMVPQATYRRRTHRVKVAESERAWRLASVIATAEYVSKDVDQYRFLWTPHAMLEDRRPIDVALNQVGARRVEEILWGAFLGGSTS